MAGSIGRQSHYGGARVQCLPGAVSGDRGLTFITMAMCNTHNTQVGSCVVIFALISKAIRSSCIDRAAETDLCMCVCRFGIYSPMLL